MVPTSALRETVVLIIFGIVLVPIAAKRAQDAPGYWQTFSSTKPEQSLAYREEPLWSSRLALMVNETLTYGLAIAEEIVKIYHVHSGSIADVDQKPNQTIPVPASRATRAEIKPPLTIRFHVAKVGEKLDVTTTTTTTESSNMAKATAMPSVVSNDKGSTATPIVARAPAASKERWTLIWTGVAIMVVALFMSFC
ncbi:hypothetical protein VP1G_03867 [Cytospora mali]|uniref:Uncharacterized protein n=1 Tax=Cytospora mali TaxID=578113 RepID=A0A194UY58_CYTMA|nr:hypothetical protein VP1G_03867 [Valsa mali var. pyri (nom. inval.)]